MYAAISAATSFSLLKSKRGDIRRSLSPLSRGHSANTSYKRQSAADRLWGTLCRSCHVCHKKKKKEKPLSYRFSSTEDSLILPTANTARFFVCCRSRGTWALGSCSNDAGDPVQLRRGLGKDGRTINRANTVRKRHGSGQDVAAVLPGTLKRSTGIASGR